MFWLSGPSGSFHSGNGVDCGEHGGSKSQRFPLGAGHRCVGHSHLFYSEKKMKFVFHMPFSVAPEEALSEIPKNITRDPSKTYLAQPEAVEALIRLCSTASRDGVGIVVIS